MRNDDSRRSRITYLPPTHVRVPTFRLQVPWSLASHRHALTGNRIPSMVLGGRRYLIIPVSFYGHPHGHGCDAQSCRLPPPVCTLRSGTVTCKELYILYLGTVLCCPHVLRSDNRNSSSSSASPSHSLPIWDSARPERAARADARTTCLPVATLLSPPSWGCAVLRRVPRAFL